MEKKSENQLMGELVDCLSKAAGAAGQIIHQHQDPRWHMIREVLTAIKTDCAKMATFNLTQSIAIGK